jgi:predicted nuclease of predicted toxin-antitoxin system
MTLWIDAQMSPAIAVWISSNFPVNAVALRDLGLRDATDREIFFAARRESAIVMTKDSDFVLLLDELDVPPQVIWITCGNTSNPRLKEILTGTLTKALQLVQSGEKLVEINAI